MLGIGGWSRVKTYKLTAAGRHAQPRERPCRRFLHNGDHDLVLGEVGPYRADNVLRPSEDAGLTMIKRAERSGKKIHEREST